MSELADYYRLRDKDLLSGSVAIVEGHTLVRRLLGMGLVPRSLLCVRGQEDIYAPLLPSGCPIYSMDHEEIRELIGYKFHRGVLAAVDRPTIRPLAASRANITANLVLNLEGIQEGSNFGGDYPVSPGVRRAANHYRPPDRRSLQPESHQSQRRLGIRLPAVPQ
jgi:tRNA G18 (ribose-2'-O)-methylase SpoU